MKKILIWSFLSIIVFGCKKNTPEKQHAEIYFRFDDDAKTVKTEASFYKKNGQEMLPLLFDNVTIANHPMKRSQLSEKQTRYGLTLFKRNKDQKFDLNFWNKGETPVPIEFNINAIDTFYFENTIIKKEGVNFVMKGQPIHKNEKIYLFFVNDKNQSAKIEILNVEIGKPIKIDPNSLTSLFEGQNEVYALRSKSQSINHPHFEGLYVLDFYSKPQKIMVNQ